ncbi:MAG: exostosin family protein [Planctomycetota bacterium]
MTIAIHFFGAEPDRQTNALAASAGVGRRDENSGADVRRFERLFNESPRRWRAVEPGEADVFVYAHDYTPAAHSHPVVEIARTLGKPCLYLQESDDATSCTPAYGVIYRESILASLMTPQERALAAFADDLAREAGGFAVRPKGERPSVGFCGYVGSAWRRAFYRVQGRKAKVYGLDLRSRALGVLERDPGVEAHFIRRTAFWGGTIGRFSKPDPDAKRRVRQEYLENIAGSDYTLCLRGAGNFSYRLYETLAMGRVPLFVNTDCALPFADEIDWRRHVVWVEESEMRQLGARLREFHAALTPDAFEQLQRDNRQVWEDYLRPTECYQHILDRELNRQTGDDQE